MFLRGGLGDNSRYEVSEGLVTAKRVSENAARAKRRKYFEAMEPPTVPPWDVVKVLREQPIIQNKELYDLAGWWVYRGNVDVIRQVIINRQFEITMRLPEEHQASDYTVSRYFVRLWGTDKEKLVRQRVLQEWACKDKIEPHFIYYLLQEGPQFESEAYKVYYAQLLFYDQILAYLRIYSKSKGWPTIRELCRNGIMDYPCVWNDLSTVDKALEIADRQAAEEAYRFYMDRYRRNYQETKTLILDAEVESPGETYEAEYSWEGWSSEDVHVKMRVYGVDSNTVGLVEDVRKIVSVFRDGEDITERCKIMPHIATRKPAMAVPLEAGEVVELEFQAGVTLDWWWGYMQRNVAMFNTGKKRGEK
jgi:hypothetical protein